VSLFFEMKFSGSNVMVQPISPGPSPWMPWFNIRLVLMILVMDVMTQVILRKLRCSLVGIIHHCFTVIHLFY